jgi:hypothetical protein
LVYKHLFESLLFILLWNGVAKSYGNFMFNLLKNCQTTLHSDPIILYSYQQYIRIPVFSHIWQWLLFSKKNYHSHSNECEVYLILVLVCIFLITNDEYPFVYLLFIWISSGENTYSNPLNVLELFDAVHWYLLSWCVCACFHKIS